MAAHEMFGKGNEAFVAENYKDSIEYYNKAIAEDETKDEYYSSRAHAHIKLESYIDAVADATKAIEINPQNPKAFLRKGIASFHLEEFESAKQSFMEGKAIDASDTSLETWLQKCEEKLKSERTADKPDASKADANTENQTNKPAEIPMPSGPKTKYDWYQTEAYVVLTIMLKNVKKNHLKTDIEDRTLSVTIAQDGGSDYSLELDLLHAVDPKRSVVKILSSKVEIKLKKVDGIRWNKLEGEPEAANVKHFVPDAAAAEAAPKYPSSSTHARDWDKLVADIKQEEKDEKLEGDAALNNLFQQIYRDGSDEVRKAMNKSFVESAGTVLSTNWSDVGKKEMEVKPPDGMEFKKWEK